MMDHVSDKPHDHHWEVVQHNVVQFLLDKWDLSSSGFNASEVNHIIGSLEVNAFEVSSPAQGRGRGVYPLTALMSHNCISNARYYKIHHGRLLHRGYNFLDFIAGG